MKTNLVVLACLCLALQAQAAPDLPMGTWTHQDDSRHTFTLVFGPGHDMAMGFAQRTVDGQGEEARGEYEILGMKNGDFHGTFRVQELAFTGYTPPGQSRTPRRVSILGLDLRYGDQVNFFVTHECNHPPTLQLTVFDSQQQPIFSRIVAASQ